LKASDFSDRIGRRAPLIGLWNGSGFQEDGVDAEKTALLAPMAKAESEDDG